MRWRPYVLARVRHANAAGLAAQSRRNGVELQPIELRTRKIATSFWGKAWCDNLERYSDYRNRLPRGRTYVRNGSVIDLKIGPGTVRALVSGSRIYETAVKIRKLPPQRWQALIAECSGRIGSLLDLLQGRFSSGVMEVLARREHGLFPAPAEIEFSCSCPDWAAMCKHVAAVLYGVGARFDSQPELFFTLRQVDSADLIAAAAGAEGLAAGAGGGGEREFEGADLGAVFGIALDTDRIPVAGEPTARTRGATSARRRTAKTKNPEPRRAEPDDDGLGEVFGEGLEVTQALLAGFGVSRATCDSWRRHGVLLPMGERGVYRTTAATLERVRRVFARSLRGR